MSEYQIPKSKFDVLKNIMIGWYRAGAADGPISNEDVQRYTSISKSTISRQNKFLTQLGILEKEGHSRSLTEEGKEVTKELANAQEDEAKRLMRPLLEELELTEQLHSIVEMTGPLTEQEMIGEVAAITGHDADGRAKTGLRAFVELYEWAGYFEEDDGQYNAVSRSEFEEPSLDQVDSTDQSASSNGGVESSRGNSSPEESKVSVSPRTQAPSPNTSSGLNITVEISSDQSPREVKNTIVAIREALEYDLEQTEDGSSSDASPTILSDFEEEDTSEKEE